MYTITVFMPLLSSIISGFFGWYLGKGSAVITVMSIFIACVMSFSIFFEVGLLGSPVYLKLATWIKSDTLNVDWGFLFDSLTVSMCVIVTFISLVVHLYSVEYMKDDPHLPRFMSYLSLFTFFMLILITADNYVQLFMGWEGVGLCSYLLINFWFTWIQANKAAIKAMLVNRVGDFFLLIAIFAIATTYKSVNYLIVANITPFYVNNYIRFFGFEIHLLTLIGVFLFLGAVGKSAQLGLHTWLPDAMEGPTPVSALIHAATMVTAGVFLIIRNSFLFSVIPNVLDYIAILGALTAFFASTVGLVQNDIKRVVAYSTCSQLGYMIFACGLSHYSLSFFHLSNHAFFKALLFLSAGSVIHAVYDEQDMRKMGGLKYHLPFTYIIMFIGSLALIGFPFLSGFYSKDLILEAAYCKYTAPGFFCYVLGTLGAFLTSFYSTRLLYLIFLSNPNGHKKVLLYAVESEKWICLSLGFLAIPSTFIGYCSKDMLVGCGTLFFGNSVYNQNGNHTIFDAEFIPVLFKLLPVIFSFLGLITSLVLYNFYSWLLFKIKTSFLGKKVYCFLNWKWFLDKIYNEFGGQLFFKCSFSVTYKLIDWGIFEIFGPKGISNIIFKTSVSIHKLQTGFIYHYNLIIMHGITTCMLVYYFVVYLNYFKSGCVFLIMMTVLMFDVKYKVLVKMFDLLLFLFKKVINFCLLKLLYMFKIKKKWNL